MRINQYLAKCKLGSRRKVEEYINNGKVTINDELATLSSIVSENDEVKYLGNKVTPSTNYVYYMLNKPVGYISSVSDEEDRRTVISLIKTDERVYPVGRLDYNTEGLLLITNDGDFTNKVTHPKNNIGKTYVVKTRVELSKHELKMLRSGVDIDGEKTSPAIIQNVKKDELDYYYTTITIFEGKNHEVRNMFKAVNKKVLGLKRIAIGKLELGNLPTRKYKQLTLEELKLIFE